MNSSKLHNWWVAAGGQGSGFECYGVFWGTMTSYTKRCTISWRVCWCKLGRNPTNTCWEICILLCLSWVPRQGNILDFACLTIYDIATSPELFACLTIYENAETLSNMYNRYAQLKEGTFFIKLHFLVTVIFSCF